MDHPTSLSRAHPWRTTAIVAAGLAAFELVLLVMVGLAFLGSALGGPDSPAKRLTSPSPSTATPATAKKKAAPAAPAARLSRAETSVMVLNGNGRPGAAGETADLVRTRNYLIAGTGNAPRTNFARSIVMFRPGYKAEASRLARDFGIKRVAPLDGLKLADLQGAHVALVVGAAK